MGFRIENGKIIIDYNIAPSPDVVGYILRAIVDDMNLATLLKWLKTKSRMDHINRH